MNKKDRISELVNILNEAGKAYYQESREVMSNFEYDKLYDELKELEEATGIVLANSPTINVGYEVISELVKERHISPMLSLDKTKQVEGLKSFLSDKEGIISWKLDGLTIVLNYENGILAKAVTRGNGEVGEIVTNNARTFKNLPLTIPFKGSLTIRGEAVIKYSDFENINAQIGDVDAKYKNPRNLCSGSVRQLNNEITAKRNVNIYIFTFVKASNEDSSKLQFNEISEQYEWLEKQGFSVVEHFKCNAASIEDNVKYFAKKIEDYDIPSDGLVIMYNDVKYGESLGKTAKFPRNGIAFKWADETAITKLKYIEWSASRTGLINPVAVFEPVELEGTTVSRASVHNISILEGLRLGIGDELEVYKANMIIPQIANNITKSANLIIPDSCPVCNKPTSIKQINDVKSLYCENPECPAKKIKQYAHFVERDALNIEGLSEETLEKFIDSGYIEKFADIFHLDRYKDDIVNSKGFGLLSYENIINSVNKARKVNLAALIYALGIPNIGVSNAKMICKHFDYRLDSIIMASVEELADIEGVGEVIAKCVFEYFHNEENVEALQELLKELTVEKPLKTANSEKLKGTTFVITGSLNSYENRDELKAVIEDMGGKVAGSVSSKTGYLINNDALSSSSKNKKAQELGVKIITEDEFNNMFVI